jgi:hypothetical protein
METRLVNVCLTSNFLSNNENREIYAVRRPSAQRASAVAPTQAEAIEIARLHRAAVRVGLGERVQQDMAIA